MKYCPAFWDNTIGMLCILMTKLILLAKYFKLQREQDELTYYERIINYFIAHSF